MIVRGRKRLTIGPVVLNVVSDGIARWRVSSWGLRLGRWSWNSRTGRCRVDLPGPWSWTSGRARRGRAER